MGSDSLFKSVNGMQVKGFAFHGKVSPIGWEPDGDLSYEQWEQDGQIFQRIDGSLNWIIGDWLNYGERKYGEMYAQAIEWTGNKLQHLKDIKWVASSVKTSSRDDVLSFTHHRYIAHLPDAEQREWLAAAVANEWSSRELLQALESANAKRKPLPQPQWTKEEPTENKPPVADVGRELSNEFTGRDALGDEDSGDERNYGWDTPSAVNVEGIDTHVNVGPVTAAATSSMAVHYSSDKMDWETPQDLFDMVNDEFGFTLDVCATDETAKCDAYFTPDDDGLAQDWSKNICWMNPPYGDEISGWVKKAYQESRRGATVVCLVPARVDTSWWWDNCINGEIRFLKGRLKFRQNGNEENAAPFPSALVIFSERHNAKTIWWNWKQSI